jgi:carbonic anhydrase
MAQNPAVEEAVTRLMEGNRRFTAGKAVHPHQSAERRQEVAKGQKPFAVVIGCSDSRIPPEILFDQGIGDIFVIRVAGNIVDDIGLGSVEYAVDHLGSPLVLVLGHGKCGAVSATVQGGEAHGHIGSIVNTILPAVKTAKGQPGDVTENAIRENAKLVALRIASAEPMLAGMVREGKIGVLPAYYNIETGVVEIL